MWDLAIAARFTVEKNIDEGTSCTDVLVYPQRLEGNTHSRRNLPSFHTSATPSLSCFYPNVWPADSKPNPEPSIRAWVRQTSTTEVPKCQFPMWKKEAKELVSPFEKLAGLRCCPLPGKLGVRERPGTQKSQIP